MNYVPSVQTVKEKIGFAVYYFAVPIMMYVGYRCAVNAPKEMEEMAAIMNNIPTE
jgi:hypothetical protein